MEIEFAARLRKKRETSPSAKRYYIYQEYLIHQVLFEELCITILSL